MSEMPGKHVFWVKTQVEACLSGTSDTSWAYKAQVHGNQVIEGM